MVAAVIDKRQSESNGITRREIYIDQSELHTHTHETLQFHTEKLFNEWIRAFFDGKIALYTINSCKRVYFF